MTGNTVVLIDANRLFCAGLERILAEASFAVVHEASSIEDALPFIEALQPAVVLVDLPASREAAAAGISRIREIALRSRIVVLTETIRLAQLADGLLGGIDGYLLKNISADALPQSLRLVLLGEKVFPTDLAQLLTDGREAADRACQRPLRPRGRNSGLAGQWRPEQADSPGARHFRQHRQSAYQGHPPEDRRAESDPGGDLGARSRFRQGYRRGEGYRRRAPAPGSRQTGRLRRRRRSFFTYRRGRARWVEYRQPFQSYGTEIWRRPGKERIPRAIGGDAWHRIP
jgi:DNA-binding NarL/FixJ family response regulator